MRRFFLWYLPLATALTATVIFGAGFYSFLRGDTGQPVAPVTGPIRASAPAAKIAPLLLGDSLARGQGDDTGLGIGGRLVDDLKKAHVQVQPSVNLAVNGAITKDLEAQLESRSVQTLIAQSNVIVISIGGNDLWGGAEGLRRGPTKNPEKVMNVTLDSLDRIVKKVRTANPRARIFIVGLYNPFVNAPFGTLLSVLVNKWNGMEFDGFAADTNVTIVETSDLFSHRARLSLDNFHPNDEGYELIARRIAESL
ncbi:MAG TPA: GDSL-type esterase/lipase family protein [Thermoanaerobaculia bacterium]|jgi:lysophospholipase L1-like esterase